MTSKNSGIRWRGDNIASYADVLRRARNEVVEMTEQELHALGEEGVRQVRNNLVPHAGTRTNPLGRYETWMMHDSSSYTVHTEGERVILRFGWPEWGVPYVKFQDKGTNPFGNHPGIPAANSLLDAYIKLRSELQDRGYRSA